MFTEDWRELERKAHEKVKADRAEALKARYLKELAIPARYKGKGFTSYVTNDEQQKSALNTVKAYQTDFQKNKKEGRNLFLMGRMGTGKTMLAYALAVALIEAGFKTKYFRVADMIRVIRESWKDSAEQTEREILEELGEVDLLILDEVGVQTGSENEKQLLFDVLDRRYNNMAPTVLIGNVKLAELQSYIGDRVFNRLQEGGPITAFFTWESHRK